MGVRGCRDLDRAWHDAFDTEGSVGFAGDLAQERVVEAHETAGQPDADRRFWDDCTLAGAHGSAESCALFKEYLQGFFGSPRSGFIGHDFGCQRALVRDRTQAKAQTLGHRTHLNQTLFIRLL